MKTVKLIILSVCFLVFIAFILRQQNEKSKISNMGKKLCTEIQNSNLSSFEFVGQSVMAKFKTIPKNEVQAELRIGDAKSPIGDGSASMCIIIKNQTSSIMGLRIKYTSSMLKPKIVGFWSL